MMAELQSITEDELAEALRRKSYLPDPDKYAREVFADAVSRREPECEPGEMYQDADGRKWLYLPERNYANAGSWADCPWLKPGDAAAYSLNSPKRPLRRLVPEGSHEAAEVLVAKWRGLGEQDDAVPVWRGGYRAALRKCADELEDALKHGGSGD